MTSVHERNREKSPELLRFQTLAQSLDDNATRVAAKVIPKNYRFIIGVQMANAANELAELVDESLEHYPSNSVEAQERRRCYAQAIAKAKTIKRLANKAKRLKLAKASEFDVLVSDASEFVKCVHGLKKNI